MNRSNFLPRAAALLLTLVLVACTALPGGNVQNIIPYHRLLSVFTPLLIIAYFFGRGKKIRQENRNFAADFAAIKKPAPLAAGQDKKELSPFYFVPSGAGKYPKCACAGECFSG